MNDHISIGLKFFSTAVFAVLLFCVAAFPQGGSGGGKATIAPKAPVKPSTRSSKPAAAKPKPAARSAAGSLLAKNTPARVGAIELTVSEPNSEVFLSDRSGSSVLGTDPRITPDDVSAITLDEIAAGVYTLVVTKPNFTEERRQVVIAAGKTAKLDITLRSSVAFLTVDTNVASPEIEITGLGVFHDRLNRAPIKPGAYTVTIRKKGFISASQSVTIDALGTEYPLLFTLHPVSIDPMLGRAEEYFRSRDDSAALNACAEIIDIFPDDPRAYFIRGRILFQNGSAGAGAAFLGAVQNGGVIAFPVRIFSQHSQLIEGDLSFDRNYMQFRAPGRTDLNFSIVKSEISSLTKGFDGQNVPYVGFNGRGDFAGKRAERNVAIYSQSAALRHSGKDAFCPQIGGAGALKCAADMDNLHEFIADWLTQLR